MVIFGCGIDIVENKRIKKICDRKLNQFINRIFSHEEIENNHFMQSNYLRIAGCWALKESFVKATGYGVCSLFSFKDIQIFRNDLGRPHIILSDRSEKNLLNLINDQQYSIHCSISHENLFSVAQTIIEVEK